MTTTEIPTFNPGDSIDITMDWLNLGTANLSSVSHGLPSGLTKVGESTDVLAGTSTVRVSGGVHGQLYQLSGTATLDNGRTLVRTFPRRCMNA